MGHVDHGKTALVRALTGQETDRLAEEQRRGISITLGFAHLTVSADVTLDLIDMPGHERFVRTLISGATGIDAMLLVVAANEGIKPQTIEHVHIAALLGLSRVVLALTKVDLVPLERAAQVGGEVLSLLVQAGLKPCSVVMTSATRGQGMEELRQALKTLATIQSPRSGDGPAYLPIDRAFSIPGHGPVVTGTLRGANVAAADMLELLPGNRSVRVRGVQVHGETVGAAVPGQRVALNLRDVETGDLTRGMVLAAPGTLTPSDWLTIAIRAVPGGPALKSGMWLRMMFGTDELDVRLRLLDREVLEPGQNGFAQLHTREPVCVPTGEYVILQGHSPSRVIAGGRLLECGVRRLRRNHAPTLEHLEDLRTLPTADLVATEVRRAGRGGTTLQQLARLTALTQSRVTELLLTHPVVVTGAGWVIWKPDLESLLARIPVLLAAHTSGMSREKMLSELCSTGGQVLDEALGRLRANGIIVERGGLLLIPRPDRERLHLREETELAARIAETLRHARLTPPSPTEIVTSRQSKRALDLLLRNGVVVRTVDRAKGREIVFHREAIEDAQRRLAPLLEQPPGLLVTEIGAALGISRKYSMPLLDHLDEIQFTRRIQDRRIRVVEARSFDQ
jgi:selenocysteine-specific elongation factor